MMDRHTARLSWMMCAFILTMGAFDSSYGQSDAPVQLPSQQVPDSGPFQDGRALDEFQALGNGTIASRVLQASSLPASSGATLQFQIRVISVDTETRQQLYELIGHADVSTHITKPTGAAARGSAKANSNEQPSRSTYQASRPTVVSTAVLDSDSAKSVWNLISQRESSRVIATPTVLTAIGQESSLEQTVQRPFVSSVREVTRQNQTAVESELQVVDEGFCVKVCGKPSPQDDAIKVELQVQQSSVAGVEEVEVFGVGASETRIQVPTHQVREASASVDYSTSETLLLDPYFQVDMPRAKQGAPIEDGPLSNVERVFAKTTPKKESHHLIVLMGYQKIADKAPQAGRVIQAGATLPVQSGSNQ